MDDVSAIFGEVKRCKRVDLMRVFRIAFCSVNSSVGGAVDDEVKFMRGKICLDGGFVGQIQILAVDINRLIFKQALQGGTELPVGSGY